jgi:sugar/nucleoside kinase (ribokinase family)
MRVDVAGLGNALMDALVVIDDDSLLEEMGLTRGTMHPVGHQAWQEAYERVRHLGVTFDSGGSCANTIATVGRLGRSAVYCGQVGNDQMGRLYASLIEEATGHNALRFTEAENTGKCLSIISRSDAERTMLTDLGAAVLVPELAEFEAQLCGAKTAHFTGYTLLDGPMRATALAGIRAAKSAGAMVSLDAADPFVVDAIGPLLWELTSDSVDILFLNAEEARRMTGAEGEKAAQVIHDRSNVSTIIVKLGSEGSLVRRGADVVRVEPKLVAAIDTTGAGDAYAGGFLYGLAAGWSVERSGRLASAVASLTVGQIGAVVKDGDALAACIDATA